MKYYYTMNFQPNFLIIDSDKEELSYLLAAFLLFKNLF